MEIGTTRLTNTGFLFRTNSRGVFVGLSTPKKKGTGPTILYRYDVNAQPPITLSPVVIEEAVGEHCQHPDRAGTLGIGNMLCTINLSTLARTQIECHLEANRFIVSGNTVISANGATLEVYEKS